MCVCVCVGARRGRRSGAAQEIHSLLREIQISQRELASEPTSIDYKYTSLPSHPPSLTHSLPSPSLPHSLPPPSLPPTSIPHSLPPFLCSVGTTIPREGKQEDGNAPCRGPQARLLTTLHCLCRHVLHRGGDS